VCPSLTTSRGADRGGRGHDFSSGTSLCRRQGEGDPPAAILPQQLAWNCLWHPLPRSSAPFPSEHPRRGHGCGVGSGRSPGVPLCSPVCRTPTATDRVALLPHRSRVPRHAPAMHAFVGEQAALAARKSNL